METKRVDDWRAIRDEEVEERTADADRLLVDRAIVHAVVVPHDDSCDSANVLRLTLDDGSVVDITGGYGGYTGDSCDEYVEVISIDAYPPR